MRIAMLGHKRVPSREGGVEVVAGELATRLAALGHEVTCYNRAGHHVSGKAFNEEKRREYRGVRLITVPTVNIKGVAAMSASLFASIRAALGRYDVVHFHTEGPCATLWLPKLLGKRCIVTVHGLDHQRSKWGRLARSYILLGEKVAARFADEIIVLSEGVQRYFLETYKRQTTLIPNGLPQVQRRTAELITQRYGVAADEYFLYLGRITPEKGIGYLIEAFRRIRTDKKLIVAGGASDSAEYFAQLKAQAADDPRIIFTDFVQGQVLEELYSNAMAYVLPSDLEGMPISLLEAISFGNCCLVSDIPENSDVAGECGVTFRRGDPDDLARQLSALLETPEMVSRCRQAAKAAAARGCTWDTVTERTLRLYEGSPS